MEDQFESQSSKINFYLDKMWLLCENAGCLKWRLLSKKDASQFDLNRPWYCNLSPDPHFNDCSVPEEHFPDESQFFQNGIRILHSTVTMGSLVNAKLHPWPWWPGILCPDPVSGEEIIYNGHKKYYHVEFLGKPHTHALVSLENVIPFNDSFKPQSVKLKTQWLKSALEEAKEKYAFSCEQRMDMCHITKAYKEKVESNPQRVRTLEITATAPENCVNKNTKPVTYPDSVKPLTNKMRGEA
ncbi:zinc finger CW-type PWWP domain protein 2 [Bombina bombina]|uniref:zinc finger CW-type PWWP domain protein 2 n=1 Tax=Bombina bombina TaxID=8345 RepID=UPI00235A7D03|nr:zinc finger CW-type PWWP domain protein 2 [Bombina bombina]